MLKQGTKTINAEFIWTCALSQLSFVQFKSYEPCSRWASSLFGVNAKIKKTMETSLSLTALFKTSIDARAQGLVLNVDYLENRQHNFIKKKKKEKKVAEKDICCAHTFCSLDCNFSVFTDFLRCWWLLKVGLSPSSLVNDKVQYTYCSISYELKATRQWNLVS